jgi:hypothetical protein
VWEEDLMTANPFCAIIQEIEAAVAKKLRVRLEAQELESERRQISQALASQRWILREEEQNAARAREEQHHNVQVTRELSEVDLKVTGYRPPLQLDISEMGYQSVLESPQTMVHPSSQEDNFAVNCDQSQENKSQENDATGPTGPTGHQSQEDNATEGGSNLTEEAPEVDVTVEVPEVEVPEVVVFPYDKPGAVDARRNDKVSVLKFGCMLFAVPGSKAIGVELHQQLRRMFVEPVLLKVVCSECAAEAPSAVMMLLHKQTKCCSMTTPIDKLWLPSVPLFFFASHEVIENIECDKSICYAR